MKNENSKPCGGEMLHSGEHDLFHLFKTASKIKVTSDIPCKEELTPIELSVYNLLLNLNRDSQITDDEFTMEFLKTKLDLKYSGDELVDAFRNLDKKYYTECAFGDKGVCVWVKVL